MAYKAGETAAIEFTITDSDGALTDADSLPTVTEVIDGSDTATSVSVTNKSTGVYKATWTISGSKDEDLAYRIEATIGGTSTAETVGLGKLDSKRLDDLNDLSQTDANTAADTALAEYDPPTKAELDSAVAGLNDLAQTDILSDGTPFAGANVDAAISSRSSHDAAAVVTAIMDDSSWDLTNVTVADFMQAVYAITRGKIVANDDETVFEYKGSDGSTTVVTLTIDEDAGTRTPS